MLYVEGGLVGKKRIVSDISFTSLSLTIVSAPIISLCLGPSCKVLFSLNTLGWGRPLDRVGFSLNWPILDRVLWYSRLLVGWISLGWALAGPRFSLFWIFEETSPEQVVVRREVFSVRIGWFSAFSLCGFSLFLASPITSLFCGPPIFSLFCGGPKFSVFLSRTRGLCSGVTSAARTKWVGSGPLSTPEIEIEGKRKLMMMILVVMKTVMIIVSMMIMMGDFCHKNRMRWVWSAFYSWNYLRRTASF